MVKKKTASERELHHEIMVQFEKQVEMGEAQSGYTFSSMRVALKISVGDDNFAAVAVAMSGLRDTGFLAHKFTAKSLAEDFYLGDPTDIPNIRKEKNADNVRQISYFMAPAALALDDGLEAAVEADSFPTDPFEYETTAHLFNKESIAEWFETLGQMIDTHSDSEEYTTTSGKMLAALMPVE